MVSTQDLGGWLSLTPFRALGLSCALSMGIAACAAGQGGGPVPHNPGIPMDSRPAPQHALKAQRKRSVPPLSGSADAPCWVKPGETLTYIVRSVGQFETPPGGAPRNIDTTTRARPVMLRSIRPDSLQVRTAVLPNGERVYRVTGTAR